MRCRKLKSYTPKYYEGDLSFQEKEKLSRHAKDCPFCREELYQMDRLKEILSNVDTLEPSPYFNAKLWARIRQEEHRAVPEISFTFKQKVRWALATCLVTIVILSAIVLTDPRFSLLVKKEPKTVQKKIQTDKYQILIEPDKIHYVMDKYKPLPKRVEVDNPREDKDYQYILERKAYPQLVTTGEHYVLPMVSTQNLKEESY
jgi:hypothetical protein